MKYIYILCDMLICHPKTIPYPNTWNHWCGRKFQTWVGRYHKLRSCLISSNFNRTENQSHFTGAGFGNSHITANEKHQIALCVFAWNFDYRGISGFGSYLMFMTLHNTSVSLMIMTVFYTVYVFKPCFRMVLSDFNSLNWIRNMQCTLSPYVRLKHETRNLQFAKIF